MSVVDQTCTISLHDVTAFHELVSLLVIPLTMNGPVEISMARSCKAEELPGIPPLMTLISSASSRSQFDVQPYPSHSPVRESSSWTPPRPSVKMLLSWRLRTQCFHSVMHTGRQDSLLLRCVTFRELPGKAFIATSNNALIAACASGSSRHREAGRGFLVAKGELSVKGFS